MCDQTSAAAAHQYSSWATWHLLQRVFRNVLTAVAVTQITVHKHMNKLLQDWQRMAASPLPSTNNFGSCQIFCTLDSGRTGRCSLNWPFPWTNLGLHLIHGSQVPPESTLRTASWSYLKELTDHFCQRYSEQIRLAPHPFFLPKNFNETLFFVCEQHSSCKQNVELCFC